MNAIHSLSSKNTNTRTATCSICGPVDILPAGDGWVCKVKRNESRKRRRKAAADGGAASRGKKAPSTHRLQNRTGGQDVCAVCGPVTSIPQGRGWMCPTRAKELGWVKTPAAVQPKCDRCQRLYLDADGRCPACDDRMHSDLNYSVMVYRHRYRTDQQNFDWFAFREDLGYADSDDEWFSEDPGFVVGYQDSSLGGDDEASVTPWLKTIGSRLPVSQTQYVLPAYAAAYKGGAR